MSLTTRVIAGLALGLAAGAAAHFSGHPLLLGVADLVEPIGTIWVNAILMTVIPLVVSSLIVGVASTADARAIGRLG
jgi:proton glutamate symport protein